MRAITRMTGVSRNTINKLLCDLGRACFEYQDKAFRNLPCKRVQCDEIWSFIGAKEKSTGLTEPSPYRFKMREVEYRARREPIEVVIEA
jgi:hypothetical protein